MSTCLEVLDSMPHMMAADCLGIFLGKKIGHGTFRDVYEFGMDEDLVVKIELRDDPKQGIGFCNVHEHAIWVESKDHAWRKWLAPVIRISSYGSVLVMRRTKPLRPEQLPSVVPNFLSDMKLENWGMYDGRPVVHDYGNHAIYALARDAFDMVAPEWHDGKGGSGVGSAAAAQA